MEIMEIMDLVFLTETVLDHKSVAATIMVLEFVNIQTTTMDVNVDIFVGLLRASENQNKPGK